MTYTILKMDGDKYRVHASGVSEEKAMDYQLNNSGGIAVVPDNEIDEWTKLIHQE